jgi:hypothetical protein
MRDLQRNGGGKWLPEKRFDLIFRRDSCFWRLEKSFIVPNTVPPKSIKSPVNTLIKY